MIACYQYMTFHNYDYLFAFDTVNYFNPKTKQFLDIGNLGEALKAIWSNYSYFSKFQYGYFTYSTLFAYLGNALGANFYIVQNISVLFLYSFTGVLLYRIMLVLNIDEKISKKYTIIISLCSVAFCYSSQILRDVHILLIYLGAIYLTLKPELKIINIIGIIFLSLLCCLFRIESGLFLFILVPVYILLVVNNSRAKIITIFISLIVIAVGVFYLRVYKDTLIDIYSANEEYYSSHVSETAGVIGSLQKIPVLGDLISIVYTALQPVPCWSRLWVSSTEMKYGGEVYNIMNFPRMISAFFNCFVIIYIVIWLFSRNIRFQTKQYINKPFKYQLWIGLLFLYLQAAVVEQRRLMAYYFMYYILFVIIYTHISKTNRKQINVLSLFAFIALQLVGIVLYK